MFDVILDIEVLDMVILSFDAEEENDESKIGSIFAILIEESAVRMDVISIEVKRLDVILSVDVDEADDESRTEELLTRVIDDLVTKSDRGSMGEIIDLVILSIEVAVDRESGRRSMPATEIILSVDVTVVNGFDIIGFANIVVVEPCPVISGIYLVACRGIPLEEVKEKLDIDSVVALDMRDIALQEVIDGSERIDVSAVAWREVTFVDNICPIVSRSIFGCIETPFANSIDTDGVVNFFTKTESV